MVRWMVGETRRVPHKTLLEEGGLTVDTIHA